MHFLNSKNEVEIMNVLGKNIFTSNIIEFFKDKKNCYIVMTYDGKLNLKEFLQRNPDLKVIIRENFG